MEKAKAEIEKIKAQADGEYDRAVELLAEDRLVSREQGRGTFVTQKAPDAPFTSDMGQLL